MTINLLDMNLVMIKLSAYFVSLLLNKGNDIIDGLLIKQNKVHVFRSLATRHLSA